VQRDEALLAVLAGHRQHGRVHAEVVEVKSGGFAAAQAGRGNQTDQGVHAGAQQRRGQNLSPRHQLGDLLGGIQIGNPAGDFRGDQPVGDQLGGARIQGVDVSCEGPDGPEPGGLPATPGAGSGLGEDQGLGNADRRGGVGGEVVEEARDQPAVIGEAISPGAAGVEVVGRRGAQVDAHRPTSTGHGRVSAVSAVRSDLA